MAQCSMCLNDLCRPRPFCSYYNDRIAFRGATSKGGRLVPSRHLCVFGVRDDWGLGVGARGVSWEGLTPRARLNLTPNLLSHPKNT